MPPSHADPDVQRLAVAREVYRMEEEGLSISTIAEKLRIPVRQLGKFVKSEFYANTCGKLRRIRDNDEDARLEAQKREERRIFEEFGKDALDYYKLCFKRDEHGNFLDAGAAAWATEKVTKGRGWDQPPASVRATLEVRVEVVSAKMDAIRAADAIRRGEVQDAEYIEVPALPPPCDQPIFSTAEIESFPMPPV